MRLWSKSEEDDIDLPVDVSAIQEYSALGGPDPRVTIREEETISPSGWGFSTAGDGEAYVREPDGTWTVL